MPTSQVGIRMDDELLAQIDEVAELMSTSWRPVTRVDIIRGCIEQGLPALRRAAEAQAKALKEAMPEATESGTSKGKRRRGK